MLGRREVGGWVAFPCHDEVSCHALMVLLYPGHVNLQMGKRGMGRVSPLLGKSQKGMLKRVRHGLGEARMALLKDWLDFA